MNRKSYGLISLSLVIMLLLPSFALAAGSVQVIYKYGNIFAGDPYYDSAKNAYTVDFSTNTVASITLQSWSAGFAQMLRERTVNAADDGYTYMIGNNFTCNTSYQALYYDAAGNQIGSLRLVVGGLVDPSCDSGGAGETPTDKECDMCAIFECPGWDEYMAKLDSIKGAIPAAPNWNEVAGTFRDTIAPQIKKDLQDVLGSAPAPPSTPIGIPPRAPSLPDASTPNAPSAPPALGGVDDNGLTAPTGQEAPGLGDSGFSSDDIKKGAPNIQERPDPTGGFKITDPIAGLPSQDEFTKNIPEGEKTVDPGDPITEPKFEEPKYEMPKYQEPTFEMPTFDMPTIGGPNIDYDSAPSPSSGGSSTPSPPMPGEPTFTGPTINYDKAPMPSADGSKAPMPGG